VRLFHKLIVFEAAVMVQALRVRLDEGMTDPAQAEDVVRDIAAGLLGCSIEIGPPLPPCDVPNGTAVHGLGHGDR
jgi:hypothetical protein